MPPSDPADPRRRDVLCAGGDALMGALVALLVPWSTPARAQRLSGAVPTVDRLAIRVVTDSYHLAIAPDITQDGLTVERYGMPAAGPSLLGEFGLSLHLESWRGAERRSLLLDFGFTPQALNNNLAVLGIRPSALDALILSHGHYDHFGGLAGFLRHHGASLPPGLPLYLGGEECFCTREWIVGEPRDFGALDRAALAAARLRVTFAPDPATIADHAFTTGYVPETTFERVLVPTRMAVGVHDGVGCHAEGLPAGKRAAHVIPDDFAHEFATCFNIKDRGLVVITSCGHRGLVNSVQRAMEVTGVERLHAVVGGFHLAPHGEDYIRSTVDALSRLAPDWIVPMHCTGEVFIEQVRSTLPETLVRSYSGSRFTFGA